MNSVLATGLPRSLTVADRPGSRRTLFMFKAEGNARNRNVLEAPDCAVDERAAFQFQAMHDALTGLPNRRQFSQNLSDILSSADASRVSLMQIDLDDLKPVLKGVEPTTYCSNSPFQLDSL